ncbi:unnamed protein product [Lactuca saligna]|uniref:Uncharacterized protein n=1 Tax=Lactuca saligna TaxID=75948 RepID=A0AA35YIW8_LACSI|nr:unnamed protein product [Lactuca saligna]
MMVGGNEKEIDNLRDVEVEFNEDTVTMNTTKGDEFLSQLYGEEEDANDNNQDDDDDDGGEAIPMNQEKSLDQDDGQEYDKVELIPMEVEVLGNGVGVLEGSGEQVGQVNDNVIVGEVQVQ